jgi:4'-phosphopantetheinyl transferase
VALRRECSHQALRAILETLTGARPEFALAEKGKPYLPGAPEVRFNLARSQELALVAVALGVDVGVDIERLRPLPEYATIAERFFPPSEREGLDERDFFRRWTRIEAKLKARGVGLYGAGAELGGEWTVEEIEAGEGFAAAVAVERAGMRVVSQFFDAERPAPCRGQLRLETSVGHVAVWRMVRRQAMVDCVLAPSARRGA